MWLSQEEERPDRVTKALRRRATQGLLIVLKGYEPNKMRDVGLSIRDEARRMGMRALGPRPKPFQEAFIEWMGRRIQLPPYEVRILVISYDTPTLQRLLAWISNRRVTEAWPFDVEIRQIWTIPPRTQLIV